MIIGNRVPIAFQVQSTTKSVTLPMELLPPFSSATERTCYFRPSNMILELTLPLSSVLGKLGPRQIGPRKILGAANWAPEIFWWQIGPRQIGPRQIGPLGGKLGPGKSGPGKLGPWKMLVRQIGPLENWDPEVTNTVLQNKLTRKYSI